MLSYEFMKKTIYLLLLIIQSQIIFSQDFESTYKIPSDQPKLVVGIVVEQLREDYIDKFWNYFGDKGIKKLIINGSNFQNAPS